MSRPSPPDERAILALRKRYVDCRVVEIYNPCALTLLSQVQRLRAQMIPIIMALTLSLLITRIATVALTLTGMSRESARFQARSAFTGVGYTTTGTEQIVGHPMRRRIVMLLMLLGNIGLVTVVSALMLSFLGDPQGRGSLGIPLLIVGIVVLSVAAVSRWLDRRMCAVIEWALRKWTDIDTRDYASVLHLSGRLWGTARRCKGRGGRCCARLWSWGRFSIGMRSTKVDYLPSNISLA